MKVVSFNVNGIRARLHQLKTLIEQHSPDIIGIQETKVSDDLFPINAIEQLGYQAIYFGQKGHYGVALLYKCPLVSAELGFPGAAIDDQKRFIQGTFKTATGSLHVVNGYFPQGESRDHPVKFPNKEHFYASVCQHLKTNLSKDDYVLVLGDMNVAPEDIDVGIGEENKKRWLRTGKCCFLPEERQWLENIMDLGFVDSFRHVNQQEATYSWYDYRSGGFDKDPKRGLRIDLILASKNLLPRIISAGIDLEARGMEKPSDHCPVWVELSL